MGRRIAVGVSGAGSNLRGLAAAIRIGALDADLALVFADRRCPAIEWAAGQGIEAVVVPSPRLSDAGSRDAWDEEIARVLERVQPDAVVLAGFMRILGRPVLEAFRNRIVNTHPSLAPAFPGAHAIRDALAEGVTVTGVTVHLVDETLDRGPVIVQEAVAVLPGDDESSLRARIQAVEHRLLPWATGLLLGDALRLEGRRVLIDPARAAALPSPRRALLATWDKTGLASFGAELAGLGFELVSTGGTAAVLREAGLDVTDVAAVTGSPEMLDGRVKTLHPRVHAGILADRRLPAHREQLAASAIAPFDLVVVNLYPFGAAVDRPDAALDDVLEMIDIGGPAMVRAAAKNHASVAVVTDPRRYPQVLAALRSEHAVPPGMRAALAVEAFAHTAAYDARVATELPRFLAAAGVTLPDEPGLPGAADPYPPTLVVALEKVESLRYGENPHQPAARYRRPGDALVDGLFATGMEPLQGKQLSYNNVLDAAAASELGRTLRGPACVIVKHTNPCGAAERDDLVAAWRDALAGDPVSAYGGVVALAGPVTAELAEALAEIFLEIVIAPAFSDEARGVLARRPNLRLLVDPLLGAGPGRVPAVHPLGAIRSVGGAVLVTSPDRASDEPSGWRVVTRRAPTGGESRDLDLAWRLVRGVTSNAIVLVRDGMLVGMGSGQTSRVDAARQAVEKAGLERTDGAVCASDAFFPFPDGLEACAAAGVSAFVQPGGSMRDPDVVEAADRAGAAMLFTGVRHFRH